MYDKPLTIEQALTLLAEAPPRLAALTAGLGARPIANPLQPDRVVAQRYPGPSTFVRRHVGRLYPHPWTAC